ncbi:MAG: LTA synthase family protein [Acholeplasmataceae bacterium]|jgi:phosphoglycerol transferase MdoB-like AlkP superfamily enzyme|nr:LTA synthase family protein [Acholeplasmataceae bacterium]
MKRIKKLAQKNLIVEFLAIVFIIFTFDFIFIMNYGFGISLAHWLVAFFNVAIIISVFSLIRTNKKRYIAYVVYILIMFAFFVSDSTLYLYKKDVTSIAMLLESGKNTMRIGLKYNPLTVYGIINWLLIIAFLVGSLIVLRNIVKLYDDKRPRRHVTRLSFILFATIGLMTSPLVINAYDQITYRTPADKTVFVQKFGSITYHSKDIVTFISNAIKPVLYAEDFKDNIDSRVTTNLAAQSPLFGVLEGQNIIFIMLETGEDYAFTPEYTPNFYRLKNEGLHFSNFRTAARNDNTYDAEFKSLTSMIYMQSDNYMHTYGENNFSNALPNVLRAHGYTANSFHDFEGTFFNRDVIHPNMGFERYYALDDLDVDVPDPTVWVQDSIMFEQFKDVIAPVQEEPFFSFVLTVTPHGKHDYYRDNLVEYYDIIDQDPVYSQRELESRTLMAAQMDLDKGLGILIDDLESKDLLDSTTIVLYSDHKNYSSLEITNKYTENSDIPYEVDKVPMVIYSQRLGSGVIDTLGSHYDLTPTIMDLVGIEFYEDFYYGQSLFLANREDRPIILAYSSWISDEMTVYDENIVAGSEDFERFMEIRLSIFETIDLFEKMFMSNYFDDVQSYRITND